MTNNKEVQAIRNTLYAFATDDSGKKREKRGGEGYSSTHCGTGSAGTRRRFVVCTLVAVAVAAVVVLAGCDEAVAPDTTAPTISNPSATVTTSSATFSTTVNEAGKLFWVAYANDTTAPTDAAALIAVAGQAKTAPIIASSGSAGQTIATVGVQTIPVSNLPNGTDYDFYAVAQMPLVIPRHSLQKQMHA